MTTAPLVYLGPTLTEEEALEFLPEAMVLSPVRCGDILQALRLEPETIVIIDGTFEQTASVWHKELLLALERRILVVGAASMGALRAAELAVFGMQGVGTIYQDFLSGRLTDDDEVTVIHSPEGRALTEAMVNIRATVAAGQREGLLDEFSGNQVIAAAKQLFYHDRTLEAAIATLPSTPPLLDFATWARSGGYVDQKRCDAIEALLLVRDRRRDTWPKSDPPIVPRTLDFRDLQRSVACKAFRRYHPQLRLPEKVVLAARFLGSVYQDVKFVATLLGSLYDIARTRVSSPPAKLSGRFVSTAVETEAWGRANDFRDHEHSAFLDRIRVFEAIEEQVFPADGTTDLEAVVMTNRFFRWLLISDGLFPSRESLSPKRVACLKLSAGIWRLLDALGREAGLTLSASELVNNVDEFKASRDLMSEHAVDRWLKENELTSRELSKLVAARVRMVPLSATNLLPAFGVSLIDEHVYWLCDALRLTGLYEEAKRLLSLSPTELERTVYRPTSLREAIDLDFDSGVPGFKRELTAIAQP